ncbi:shufflon system plasmid conjugative transfer pilus tip adhesin PilV [Crenobacter sp. SG2305]|uniref:shufflon system plasmid conjugative transfer pilus tip adhesin PilV n=1 Tax=Crenobacter oryzisoli TaxID=3056844 RepID=UPI0025AA8EDB|nr:shufflon system plasmid conjugative transfer pilus tip adhesin PilV [Crenobacter sp. SG2305]MDN0082471.1 shufflon system plasmid conjugative transfer pilus tip adhesin PilV [Crenobacter sp. SG2305]
MMNTKKAPLHRQAGVTLNEFLFASALFSVAMIPVLKNINSSQLDTKLALVAQQHKQFLSAVEQDVKDNYATLTATAGPTTPVTIKVSDLITSKYLPSGFSATNNYGQTQCAVVLQPSANNLAVMTFSEGGTAMTDKELGATAVLIGAQGGGIYNATPTVASGAGGSWQVSSATTPKLSSFLSTNCSGTPASAGHLASSLYYASGTLTSDFLHRSDVPGQPGLTAMNTPLGLATRTADTACGTSSGVAQDNNRIATDSNGQVLACRDSGGGNWQWWHVGSGYWKDPVASYASLPATNNNQGDARITLDTNRAFNWNGTSWVALAVDQNGNLTVPGKITANTVTTAAGNGVQVGSSYLYGDAANSALRQNGALYVQNKAGTAAADINVGRANIGTVATANTGCGPNGSIAQDGSGAPLYCVWGVWKGSAGTVTRIGKITQGQYIPIPAGYSSYAQCTFDVVDSGNPHMGNPNSFAGNYAFAYADGSAFCGIRDAGVTVPGYGVCTYIISCG